MHNPRQSGRGTSCRIQCFGGRRAATGTAYMLDESTSALHNRIKAGTPKYPSTGQIVQFKKTSKPKKEESIIASFSINETRKPHQVKMFMLNRKEKIKI